jgi:hypothetical protein
LAGCRASDFANCPGGEKLLAHRQLAIAFLGAANGNRSRSSSSNCPPSWGCYSLLPNPIAGCCRTLCLYQDAPIIHPEFTEVTSLIAQRIEGLIRERYGSVQVTFYIDDDFSEAASVNAAERTPEVNGKNDVMGK